MAPGSAGSNKVILVEEALRHPAHFSGCWDRGYKVSSWRLLAGLRRIPAPALFSCDYSPVRASRRAWLCRLTAVLRNSLSTQIWVSGRQLPGLGGKRGYLDLQMRRYLLAELPGRLFALDLACSLLPAPD